MAPGLDTPPKYLRVGVWRHALEGENDIHPDPDNSRVGHCMPRESRMIAYQLPPLQPTPR